MSVDHIEEIEELARDIKREQHNKPTRAEVERRASERIYNVMNPLKNLLIEQELSRLDAEIEVIESLDALKAWKAT